MKRIVLSISFFTLFAGTVFPMNSEIQNKSTAPLENGGYECVNMANSVSILLETIGVPDDIAFDVATVVYHACQAQN